MHNPVSGWVRRRPLLDRLVYPVFFLLVAASVVHLAGERNAQCWYILALCLLIAVGYWSGLALADRLHEVGRAAWLGVLVVLWLTLVWISPGLLPYAYMWCAVPLACLALCTLGERAALAAAATISCLPALLVLRFGGRLGPDGVVAPLTAAWATVGLFLLQRRDALSRQRLLDELQDVQDELERRQRAAGALTERARIARDLHDTLAQELSGSRMLLQAAERDRVADPDRAWRHVHLVSEALGEHLAETRRIIDDLTPAELEDTSLETALRDLCERAQRDGAARRITFTGKGAARALSPEAAKALLRVAQGALANVREHAKAENVLVILSAQPDQTVLQVRDDGIGFSPARTRTERGRGFGLPALRERVRACGGTLSLESLPNRGTVITAALPNAGTPELPPRPRPAGDLAAVAP